MNCSFTVILYEFTVISYQSRNPLRAFNIIGFNHLSITSSLSCLMATAPSLIMCSKYWMLPFQNDIFLLLLCLIVELSTLNKQCQGVLNFLPNFCYKLKCHQKTPL